MPREHSYKSTDACFLTGALEKVLCITVVAGTVSCMVAGSLSFPIFAALRCGLQDSVAGFPRTTRQGPVGKLGHPFTRSISYLQAWHAPSHHGDFVYVNKSNVNPQALMLAFRAWADLTCLLSGFPLHCCIYRSIVDTGLRPFLKFGYCQGTGGGSDLFTNRSQYRSCTASAMRLNGACQQLYGRTALEEQCCLQADISYKISRPSAYIAGLPLNSSKFCASNISGYVVCL